MNVIIGAIDNYTWEQIVPWINSLKQSGFGGEAFLICYRITDDIKQKIQDAGITVYSVNHDPFGKALIHNQKGRDTISHQIRFYHAFELLSRLGIEKLNKVVMTDVRDVIFQKDPFPYLEQQLKDNYTLLASSEGQLYSNEAWGLDNLKQGFGPIIPTLLNLEESSIYNVGVIGGVAQDFANLCLILYEMSHRLFIPNDQSSFNVLIKTILKEKILLVNHDDPWAVHCGTCLDPNKSDLNKLFQTKMPQIVDGNFLTPAGGMYAMVHQWDRTEYAQHIIERYGRV